MPTAAPSSCAACFSKDALGNYCNNCTAENGTPVPTRGPPYAPRQRCTKTPGSRKQTEPTHV